MESTQTKNANWDTLYSTYFWKINLDPFHSRNNPNVEYLMGHSKKIGQNEATDKEQLLKSKIRNLLINGYFPRMKSIEIFMKTSFAIDKKRDPKILILYPDRYEIPEANHDVIFKKFGFFLKEFYDCYLTNRSMEHLFSGKRNPVSNDQFLDIHRFHFNGLPQLYSHAARLLTNGHPEGAVNDFIRKYKELKRW